MVLKRLLISVAALTMIATPAFADDKSESYVGENATNVLTSLTAEGVTAADRRVKFQAYMNEFANLDAVANFAIGKYAKRFKADGTLPQDQDSFKGYALAVYEYYFNEYQGKEITVTGSTDRNARDSIVDSDVLRGDGRTLPVRWRVLNRGGKYQVVDIALTEQGNVIWLGIEQRAQFLSLLDKSNGSVEALITKIDSMTEELVALRGDEAVAVEVEG